MTQKFANNFSTTVAATFGAGDTTLSLASVAGLPSLVGGHTLLLTLYRLSGVIESGHEVVRVTNITGLAATVVRNVEGAAASQFNIGDKVSLRVTALALQNAADHVSSTGNPHGLVKADIGLGNVSNTADIDKPVSTAQATADTTALNTAKAYADNLVIGLWNDRGAFNASVNNFPASGGSGAAGAILKGDTWTVSVAGLISGVTVRPGQTIRAAINTPAQTPGNWLISIGITDPPIPAAVVSPMNGVAAVGVSAAYARQDHVHASDSAKIDIASKDVSGGVAGLTLFKLNLRNAANTITSWFSTAATAARTWTLPDKDGTVAMISDITGVNSGTNTGDNAVNSLYSGLVTNATHTGDATGSGALTVIRINGVQMSGLATGILKNTTGTGAPSIAIASDFPTLNQSTTGTAANATQLGGVAAASYALLTTPVFLTSINVNIASGSGEVNSKFSTGGVNRFYHSVSGTSGASYGLQYCNDAGAWLGTVYSVVRATGAITFNSPVNVPTKTSTDNSTAAASTAFVKAQGYITGLIPNSGLATSYTPTYGSGATEGMLVSDSFVVAGITYASTFTYNTDGTLNVETITGNGKTRTVTNTYSGGVYTGFTATEV